MTTQQMAGFEARAFRDALGQFATGVTVITAAADGREPIAMTVSSFNSVSLDPPLVLFSVGREAPSLSDLLQAETFGINILGARQAAISNQFAGGRPDKWAGIDPITGTTGCPLIEPSLAAFECRHFATYDGGDHVIIVGQVLDFRTEPETTPLIFFRGGYHAIACGPAQ
ncbi:MULTISPECIES: flavin reductase family protein [Sphingobium]|uniref:Flavin reductase n=1 Tax=Sphingobium fuliginis (strain ATCC 27551) TaxID=336203 RepID=A0ABQ1F7A7_SPHSA|nr:MULTISPECIES: flavin reductase family protein [Sphingobium]RYL96302.1 flavin reductase [Sphingobium fuliginis]WDA36162.1 flavin reductase family protein [Sphingobium sp. YC-XJ3]GGA01459.1 flavin reductase [Sphingobium fuliginis]